MIVRIDDFMSYLFNNVEEAEGDYNEFWLPAHTSSMPDGDYHFHPLVTHEEAEYRIDGYRTVDPVKTFFYRFRENVLPDEYSHTRKALIGVKACDLNGIKLLDKALLNEEFTDPAYKHWRETTLIITSDCTEITPTCHCTLVNGVPYAESGFDINLSRVNDSFLVRANTDKGEEFVSALRRAISFEEETEIHHDHINRIRREVVEQLHEQNKQYYRSDDYEKVQAASMEIWEAESEDCVGCGACTNICPTCYCLILNDETATQEFRKKRSYDSCQLYGYARVAGGGTPRPQMTQRFRHRYLCKFSLMPKEYEMLGCTGCGRCVDACPGNIEIRRVVKQVIEDASREIGVSV
jgi:ferredoxin